MLHITIDEVMQSPVETIRSDGTARAAAEKIASKGIGSLVVCDNGTPVGILTDVDITQCVADGHDPETTAVEQFMASPVITIEKGASIVAAARRMREHRIKRLPVVDETDEIVGIVTTTDLSNYIPHLSHIKREKLTTSDRSRHAVRVDTAYEDEDWEYEYLGDESGIDVGDTVRFSKTITEQDVEDFAHASGDTNRLHLDAEYAAETRFGKRIVHGTLVSGLISAALARLPGLTIYLSQEVSFLGPVDIGARVTATCEVVEQIGENRFRISTDVSQNDEDVVDGEAVVMTEPLPESA